DPLPVGAPVREQIAHRLDELPRPDAGRARYSAHRTLAAARAARTARPLIPSLQVAGRASSVKSREEARARWSKSNERARAVAAGRGRDARPGCSRSVEIAPGNAGASPGGTRSASF